MSRIEFARTIKPQGWPGFRAVSRLGFELEGIVPPAELHRFPGADRDLISLADERIYGVLNRAGLLLQRLAQDAISHLGASKDRIGIYGALDLGPVSYRFVREIAQEHDAEKRGMLYRRGRSPKAGLKVAGYLQLAQLAIALGVRGPLSHYGDLDYAAWHALDHAEFDLRQGLVELAIVCGASELDDPMLISRNRRNPGLALSEGASLLVLAPGGEDIARREDLVAAPKPGEVFFGIADPLIRIVDSMHERKL